MDYNFDSRNAHLRSLLSTLGYVLAFTVEVTCDQKRDSS